MNRRRFLRVTGGGFAVGSAGLAGCLGDDEAPPPREAEVFEDVSIEGERMTIELVEEPEVQSTKDDVDAAVAALVGSLLPVGTARAGSRSSGSGSGVSGATGRGSGGDRTAPTDSNTGWAVYGGHSSGHRHDREDEATTYRASIATLGVAYVGSNALYQSKSPGPEPVDWDEEIDDPEPGASFEVDLATVTDDSVSSLELGDGPETDAATGTENETISDTETVSDGASNTTTTADNETTADNRTDTGSDGDVSATANEGWYRVGVHLESPAGDTDFDWEAADFKLERDTSGELSIDEAWHVRPRL